VSRDDVHKLGRPADAQANLAELRAVNRDEAAVQYAQIYAQWGDRAKACECDGCARARDTATNLRGVTKLAALSALTRKFMHGGGRGRSAANADTPLSCHHTTPHRKVSSAIRSGASDPPTYVRLGQQHGEMVKVAAHLVESGRLAPIVHPRPFDLSSAERAYEAVWNGSARMKGRCRDSLTGGPALPVQSAGSDETSHDSTRGELPALGH